MSRDNRAHRTTGRLSLEQLEAREVPAVLSFVVNTEADVPDSNLGDGVPLTVNKTVSLRSVIEQVNATGNGTDTYQITFANEVGQPWFDVNGQIMFPLPGNTMTIPLQSELPTIPANRTYTIVGDLNRSVTITRDPNAQPTDYYRFLSVGGGTLELNGLKLTGALNRGGDGGVLFNGVNSSTTVVNCYFASNLAKNGGAIDNSGQLTVAPQAAGAAKTEFLGNTTELFGGAIRTGAVGICTADIHDAVFTDNVAGGDDPGRTGTHKGGAIASNVGGTLAVTGCTFTANRAQEGGAIYADAPGALGGPLTFTVTNSAFESNHAIAAGAKGGAVYSGGNNAQMTGCAFRGNLSDMEGGAIYQFKGWLVLDTCTFMNNAASGPLGSPDVLNEVGLGNPTTVVLINTVVGVVLL